MRDIFQFRLMVWGELVKEKVDGKITQEELEKQVALAYLSKPYLFNPEAIESVGKKDEDMCRNIHRINIEKYDLLMKCINMVWNDPILLKQFTNDPDDMLKIWEGRLSALEEEIHHVDYLF